MSIAKAVARAWTDSDYKARLLEDPKNALAEMGFDVPSGNTVNVVENTSDTHHLVLPAAPDAAGDMSMEELEKVAGGTSSAMETTLQGYQQTIQSVYNNISDRG